MSDLTFPEMLAAAYRLHERSTDFEWGNDRDVAYAKFLLDYLADPTNEATAKVLEDIDRARAGHVSEPSTVRVLVVVDEHDGTLHGITDNDDEATRWRADLVARYGGNPEAARVYPGVVDPDGLPVEPTPIDAWAYRERIRTEARAEAHQWFEAEMARREASRRTAS